MPSHVATTDLPTAGAVRWMLIEQLRTNLAGLRPSESRPEPEPLADLPLRVVPAADGSFEVLDGFKRLGRWREQGFARVPVVLEGPASIPEQKRLLLLANAPMRTLTALDEGKVVRSLVDEDGLTPCAVGRLLGHKPRWVEARLAIGKRLSPEAEHKLGRREIGPTLARALCELKPQEQAKLLDCIERNGLTARESLALVEAFAVADEADRRQLLRDPLGRVRREPRTASISPRAVELERRLEHIRRALDDLAAFSLPDDLAPAERRRLEAVEAFVLESLLHAARVHGIAAEACFPREEQHDDVPRNAECQPISAGAAEVRPSLKASSSCRSASSCRASATTWTCCSWSRHRPRERGSSTGRLC